MLAEGYVVRPLRLEDAAALAAAYQRNREHLAPWDPVRPESFYSVDGQRAAIASQLEQVEQLRGAAWVLAHGDDVVGRVNLSNIVLGVLRSGSVGYWVDAGHLRRGLALAAVEHACDGARALGLHRVEAGTLLHNAASQAVLLRAGFVHYGTARRFLFIGGAWQDHHLYERILHDDPL
ncbi:GNAT family N-acetyltransferase [Nocardioides mesophilus]|uniref:GNAT family N-acetyltransferase n=1 Tax=Nocardioides mesophilus TaxID=433659 RepID=A0A7G9R7B3_9ACTN|nr:GNAT family protein [Nocardioides mesophilus]QNN51488.1 GNAT family N-acetyltransferase [Nocardioides mesophilus]